VEKEQKMYPMDFEEFLWAMGNEQIMSYIRQCFEKQMPLGQALHRKVMDYFRQYMLVGGMPQAVLAYIESKDFAVVDQTKKDILKIYRSDITKYAVGYEGKVTAIFDALPGQLSKKEKNINCHQSTRMPEHVIMKTHLCGLQMG